MTPLAPQKTLLRLLAVCGALLAVLLTALPLTLRAQAPGYTDWNAGRDLILNEKPDGGAQETADPNATVPQWSYGYRTNIESTDLTLYTAAEHINLTDGTYAGLEGFSGGPRNGSGTLEFAVTVFPAAHTNFTNLAADEIYTSIDTQSPDGNNVIRWTCPADGTYSYRVSWHDIDGGGGDGAAGYVVINGAQKFKGTWPNGDGQGAATVGTVALKAGDMFDVLLNANSADSSYDSTGTRVVIVPGGVIPPQAISLPLTTGDSNKLDLGAFDGGTTITLAFSGNGDLVDARYQVNADGSLYAPATDVYSFANASAAYPTQDGGDGTNHFLGGGANYDASVGLYFFAGKLTTDTTDPADIRSGAVVGTFSASPARGDWFLIGNGTTVTVPASGAHLYVAINDDNNTDNHGTYTGTLSVTGGTNPPDASDLRLGQGVSSPTSNNGSSALIGDRITYTFHLKNVGTRTLTNVVVKDVLPGVLEPVSISDGGRLQGGVVTWKLDSLAPTGSSTSRDLTLVVKTFATGDSGQNVAAAQINQVVNNLDYFLTGDGLPPAIPGLDLNNTTVLKAPLDVAITSNSSSVTPGGTLTYTVDLKNNTATKIKKPTFTLALPAGVKFVEAYYTDDGGNMIPLTTTDGGVAFTSAAGNFALNGGQTAIFTPANLKAGASAHLVLTVQVPYDVLPDAAVNFGSAQLTTKTSDGNGQNSFGVTVPDTKLSGSTPASAPALTLLKFVPDALTIVQAIGLESINDPTIGEVLALAFPNIKLDKTLDKLAKKVNPDVIDTVSPDGSFEQDVVAGSLPEITYALVYNNAGTGKLKKAVLQDRVPDGTEYVDGSAQLNGVAVTAAQFALTDNNRTLLFDLGNVKEPKPGKPSFGIATYKVRVLSADAGGVIRATGGAINTPSFLHTTFAYPSETDVFVVAPEHLTITSKQYNATPTSTGAKNSVATYDLTYKVDGGVGTQDLLIVDTLPAGATNLVGAAVSGPAANVEVANEQVIFHLGAQARKTQGVLRVQATLGDAVLNSSLAPVNSVGWVESAKATRSVVKRPVTRRDGKVPRVLTQLDVDSVYRNVAHFADPGAPKLIVSVAAPLSVKEGDTYDYLIAVTNPTDSPVVGGAAISIYLPDDAEFISGDQDNVLAPYQSNGFRTVTFPNVTASGQTLDILPHSSQLHRVRVRAPKGSRDKVFRCADVNTLSTNAVVIGSRQLLTPVAPAHSGGGLVTYVYADDQPFGNAKAQILNAALAEQGLAVAEFANRTDYQAKLDALDAYALGIRTGGGDCITFNNTAVLVPVGAGQVLSIGGINSVKVRDQDKAALAAGGGATLISQDGSSLIAAGAGNLIRLTNLVAAGAGNLVGPEGTDFTTVLNNLVAAGAGNLVAAGAGNLVAAGAGNLISQDGSGLVAAGAGNLVAAGAGNLVAAGAGNLVTGHLVSNADGSILPQIASALVTGKGWLVAAGAGNLISQDGSGLVAAGAGNLVAAGAGNLVAAGAGNLVAAGAGNIVDKGNIVRASENGSSFIHATGNGLIAAGAGNLVAAGAGN